MELQPARPLLVRVHQVRPSGGGGKGGAVGLSFPLEALGGEGKGFGVCKDFFPSTQIFLSGYFIYIFVFIIARHCSYVFSLSLCIITKNKAKNNHKEINRKGQETALSSQPT